jgi:hypothetical protein
MHARQDKRVQGIFGSHNSNQTKSISSGWCKFGSVYLHIHVYIDLVKLYTSQFFSGTCKLGRVYSNGYISNGYISNGHISDLYKPPLPLLFQHTSSCDFSSHLDFSIVFHATQ